MPKGGPDGGDGGRGGDVVLVGDAGLRDLSAFRRHVHWKAGHGGNGMGSNRHGADGAHAEVPVPVGTQVFDREGRLLGDVTAPGQRVRVARGGAGGRGNRRFATSTRQAPRFAERGVEAEEAWIELRLKLLADAGLLGFPNAGKSSLLSVLSNARPKIGDYPFTTIEPQLGVVGLGDGRQMTVADIPGLLEGAHMGHGLGDAFLAHLERCRLLIHVVDVTGEDPAGAARTIHAELAGYGAGLEERPQLLVAHKVDLLDEAAVEAAVAALEAAREDLPAVGPVLAVSSATRNGVGDLVRALAWVDAELPAAHAVPGDAAAREVEYLLTPMETEQLTATREEDALRLSGPAVDRLLARFDADNPDAMRYVVERLEQLGATSALRAAGAAPGREVRIGETAFEFRE